jgi:hypothetical protein
MAPHISVEASELLLLVELGDPRCVALWDVTTDETNSVVKVAVEGVVVRQEACFPAREGVLVWVSLTSSLAERRLEGCDLEHDPAETRTSCGEIVDNE